MSRPTTKGSGQFGPKAILAFIIGIGIGLALVSPVLPETLIGTILGLQGRIETVVLYGATALGLIIVLLTVLYRLYLKA